ncbi:MAG: ABC transporter permease [Spirochaetaceae bacterium]|nr:MAG: ABC transporter permease [Spirochaetaceae bacterium]
MVRIKPTRELSLAVLLAALIIFLSLTTNFNTVSGIYSFLLAASPTIVAAIALAMVIFTGNIDISAGTISGFVAFTTGYLFRAGVPMLLAALAGIVVGVALAGLNGLISVKFRVPSIVVTLAMTMVHIGAYATFLPGSGWVENLGPGFTWFGRGRLLGVIPYAFVVAMLVAVAMMWVAKYTRFGRSLYAVGGNAQAAVYSGINPDRTVIKVFFLEGALLGISAVMRATTRSEIMPSVFIGRELFFIAAALVGGVSIFGGVGKLSGVVLGSALVYLLTVTMIYLGFQDYYQFALQGTIILLAVFISSGDFSRLKRFLRPGTVGGTQ